MVEKGGEVVTDDGTEKSDGERETCEKEHLDGLTDGSGCTEIWEHLSERRSESSTD